MKELLVGLVVLSVIFFLFGMTALTNNLIWALPLVLPTVFLMAYMMGDTILDIWRHR